MSPYSSLLTPNSSLSSSSVLRPQSYKKDMVTPLELLNLYYSDGQSTGNKENKLWRKMNALLSWDNILNRGYQADLCPLLFFIITKALPRQRNGLDQDYASGEIVPDSILSRLKNHYLSSLRRNMILLEELKRVVEELKRNGIQTVVLKGGYLAEHVYADIACRPMGDLDILVSHETRKKSYELLRNMGYRYLLNPDHRNKMVHESFCKECLNQRVLVEVHHRLAQNWQVTNFDTEEILQSSHLYGEYLLVYLSWHAMSHGVQRLLWLCDLAEITKSTKHSLKIASAFDKSELFNVNKRFNFMISLVSRLLGQNLLTCQKSHTNSLMYFVTNVLFYHIQTRTSSGASIGNLKKLLTICLMKKFDIIRSIIRNINSRITLSINS